MQPIQMKKNITNHPTSMDELNLSENEVTPSEISQETPQSSSTQQSTTKSDRPSKMSDYLSDYFCSFTTSKGNSKGTSFPMHDYITCKRLSSSHTDFLDKIFITHEPSSYNQAKSNPNWIKAMNEELNVLKLNGTWEIVPKPSDRKVIRSRWVYKIKYKTPRCLHLFLQRAVENS